MTSASSSDQPARRTASPPSSRAARRTSSTTRSSSTQPGAADTLPITSHGQAGTRSSRANSRTSASSGFAGARTSASDRTDDPQPARRTATKITPGRERALLLASLTLLSSTPPWARSPWVRTPCASSSRLLAPGSRGGRRALPAGWKIPAVLPAWRQARHAFTTDSPTRIRSSLDPRDGDDVASVVDGHRRCGANSSARFSRRPTCASAPRSTRAAHGGGGRPLTLRLARTSSLRGDFLRINDARMRSPRRWTACDPRANRTSKPS